MDPICNLQISPLLHENNGMLPENISSRLQQFFAKGKNTLRFWSLFLCHVRTLRVCNLAKANLPV